MFLGNKKCRIYAVHGVSQTPSIYMSMKGKMLYFSMLNSAGMKKKKIGTLFSSNKEGMHGFGLHRAETIIEEHGGWCKYNSEDGAFSSEFLVPAME